MPDLCIKSHFIEISPAIIGFALASVLLIYCLNERNNKGINERNNRSVIISGFIVLASGFIFQIIASYWQEINSFSKEYKDIFSFPIINTLIAAFLVDRLLKSIAHHKEKKEIAILFINTIQSQLRALGFIYQYLNNSETVNENKFEIEIYQKRLADSKYYESAFKKVGIYDEDEIDLICKYSTDLEESLSYLSKAFLNPDKKLLFFITKISIFPTLLLGYLLVFELSLKYTKDDLLKLRKEFNDDYENVMCDFLLEKCFEDSYTRLPNNTSIALISNLIEKLTYIRKRDKKIDIYNSTSKKVICAYKVSKEVANLDLGAEFIVFSKSDLEARRKLKDLVKNYIFTTDQELTNIVEKISLNVEIISPWE